MVKTIVFNLINKSDQLEKAKITSFFFENLQEIAAPKKDIQKQNTGC